MHIILLLRYGKNNIILEQSQELLPETHEAERSRKNTLAGCVSACGAPAAGSLIIVKRSQNIVKRSQNLVNRSQT